MTDFYDADTMLPIRRHYALRSARLARERQNWLTQLNRHVVGTLLDNSDGEAAIIAHAEAESAEAATDALNAVWCHLYDAEAARTYGEGRDTERSRLDASFRAIQDEVNQLTYTGDGALADLRF